jgi:hypothetical protein
MLELIQLVLPYDQEYKRETHEQECALATVTTENWQKGEVGGNASKKEEETQ